MSTFNGLVAEFPDIRVDFFRSHSDLRPPLACFLSHVHSDHLAGLESLRSPFVYCSAATREILLRLERIPCRINYAKGILEARIQTYKHLKTLLKPLPLDTPTSLELAPGNHIQVTLFNANHCPGAVMFLFEGQGRAALYTGDIRSEPWFVNTIARSPALLEYSMGLKTLDTIYLDTSFTDNISFPTKAEGIRELLDKVNKYPPNTIFHFQAWTYGYEDVWVALSKALGTKIHVDDYKMSIYTSLVARDRANKFGPQFHLSPEAPALVGFMCGNTYHAGCLTLDENVRLHSCEKGNYCQTIQNAPVVRIQPVITRLPNGESIAELGVGGGGDDLERDAELDYLLPTEIDSLLKILCDIDDLPVETKEKIRQIFLASVSNGRKVSLDLERSTFGENNQTALTNGLQAIAKRTRHGFEQPSMTDTNKRMGLPRVVTFPYSRHSSYPELCHLVSAFKPKDVWPCTVNPAEWIEKDVTIEHLFGQHCSGVKFRFDAILENHMRRNEPAEAGEESQFTQRSTASAETAICHPQPLESSQSVIEDTVLPVDVPDAANSYHRSVEESSSFHEHEDSQSSQWSQSSYLSEQALEARRNAFKTMLNNVQGKGEGTIGLISATDNHTEPDVDLSYGVVA